MELSVLERKIKTLNLSLESENPPVLIPDSVHCYDYLKGIATESENVEKLQQERLQIALHQLQKERNDDQFSRTCLFCKLHFLGNRSLLFSHLLERHHFFIGAIDNIVFTNELLDVLEDMLKNLKCFYCEKNFKDWVILKEHMRKKQHKRINPQNKLFDRFYIVNYLELGRTWTDVDEDNDSLSPEETEEIEVMDCEDRSSHLVCLFCDEKFLEFEEALQHMKIDHQYDFKCLKKENNLSFYEQVKLINYIRKCVFERKCIVCDSQFALADELLRHMTETRHISVMPDTTKWDQALYYFSTFENDNLLCALEDIEDSGCQTEALVYPEDATAPKYTVLCDDDLRKTLV